MAINEVTEQLNEVLNAVNELPNSISIDTTLSVSGMAADAKVTGDKIRELYNEKVTDYVVAEASAVVDKVISREVVNPFRFIAFADAHQKNNDVDISSGNRDAGHGMAEILTQIGVDFVTFLGDAAWGAYTNTTEEVKEQLKTFNQYFAPAFKGENQLRIEGNHDDANYSTVEINGVAASTEKLSANAVYSMFYSYNKDVVFDPEHITDGYCYRDFPNHKIRVVCLNTNQGMGEGGVMEGYQLKWFAETALDMTDKANWNVIILSHHPLDYGAATLFKDAAHILDCFIKGIALSFTTTNGTAIAVDYTGKNCTFIANFHGHAHSFSVVQMQKYRDGAYADMDALAICIPNACFSRNNQYVSNENERFSRYSTETTYNKTAGTAKSTSFNVVTICPDEQMIYLDVYGAGIDRLVSYGNEVVKTHNIIRNLTDCTSSSTSTYVIDGNSHRETLSSVSGYTMDGATVTVTMGGVDVTTTVFADGVINIPNVTGDIEIVAVAVKKQQNPNNLIPTSVDIDGSIYNGKGFKEDTYLSGNTVSTRAGVELTGFIPVNGNTTDSSLGQVVIYLTNMQELGTNTNCRISFYGADKTYLNQQNNFNQMVEESAVGDMADVVKYMDADGYVTHFDISRIANYFTNLGTPIEWIRICHTNITEDSIITIKQPIADEPSVGTNLLDISQRTYVPMTTPQFVEPTEPHEMDYSKCYAGYGTGRRGSYPTGKIATYEPNDEDNGFTFKLSSSTNYGIEFPVALVGGKEYELIASSETNFPGIKLIKYNADATVNEITDLQVAMNSPTTRNMVITVEEGYLYSVLFIANVASTDFILKNISLLEKV